MATTQEIVDAATALGKLVAKHEAVVKMETVLKNFQEDIEAQRLFNDYQRHLAKIGQKEAAGQPIEVQDKRQLESLQDGVSHNAILRDLQIRQMDYLDLMRRVDEAIASQSPLGAVAGPAVGAGADGVGPPKP